MNYFKSNVSSFLQQEFCCVCSPTMSTPSDDVPRKRARVSTDAVCDEISTILLEMESGVTGHSSTITSRQDSVVAVPSQLETKNDNIYKKVYDLTNALAAEKEVNERNRAEMKEITAELSFWKKEIAIRDACISYFNEIIRSKDAQLAKAEAMDRQIMTIREINAKIMKLREEPDA